MRHRGTALIERCGQVFGERGRHVGPASCDLADRLDQILWCPLLGEVPRRSFAQGASGELVLWMHAHHQDAHAGVARQHVLQKAGEGGPRHGEVEQQHVSGRARQHRQHSVAVGGLARDLHVGLPGHDLP